VTITSAAEDAFLKSTFESYIRADFLDGGRPNRTTSTTKTSSTYGAGISVVAHSGAGTTPTLAQSWLAGSEVDLGTSLNLMGRLLRKPPPPFLNRAASFFGDLDLLLGAFC
jgi:hypothetical protein